MQNVSTFHKALFLSLSAESNLLTMMQNSSEKTFFFTQPSTRHLKKAENYENYFNI